MSEERRIEKAISREDIFTFKKMAIANGMVVEEKDTVTDWWGKQIANDCLYTIRNKHSRLAIGIRPDGSLVYDNMTEGIVNELLADYYEYKLRRRGYRVERRKEQDKIILEVIQ